MKFRLWATLPAFIVTPALAEKIEEVIVSASPISSTHVDTASVLNGAELRTRAAATLAETLSGQVGVSTTSFGPNVGNPVIRGQSGARVKVMQDNLDTLDLSTTSADHANTTEPLLADQIEILRGPSTLRFGSGAIGGVVNVIDSRIPRQLTDKAISGAIETRHSTVNDETATVARLDGSAGKMAWHADGLYRESSDVEIPGYGNHEDPDESPHGYIENSSARAHAYSVGGSWFGERGMFGLSINQQENEYGLPPGGHDHGHGGGGGGHDDEELVRLDMEQTRIDLKGELDQPFQGFEKMRVQMAHNDYEHTEFEGDEAGTMFENDAIEGRVELLHNPINDWKGAIGLQILDRDVTATGEEAFIPNADIQSYGLFLIEEKHWDSKSHQPWIQWGLRVERQEVDPDNSSSENHTAFSGSIAYHWTPAEAHHFSISYSLAERAPTLEELFSDGPHIASQSFDIGDRNLDNERSNNIDLGYEWHPAEPGLLQEASINVFYNQFDDYIYAFNTGVEDVDSELDIYEYVQEDARFHGIEAETRFGLSEAVTLRLFGDYVRAKLDDNGDIPRTTPARFGTELRYSANSLEASVQWLSVSEQDNPGINEEETDGYDQLDAQVQWHLDSGATPVMVFVRGTNLLNQEIRHATSYLRELAPAAGRNITTGIQVSF
ncbi:MAG: TonB-dependent receptor [Candidatus Pelagadaptatus aseana]|uniref:TonB-dependent receptor n=1 Tax=Candidatus Pelagadaptatus aseana TaxID=3120508 RepID=UPI0039B16947